MKGLSKESRLSAIKQLRVALAKKMKHELEESPEMEMKEAGGDESKAPSVSVHIATGKDINKKVDEAQKQEEKADPKDKPMNNGIHEALKKFMNDERVIKPKGVAKIVYGGPTVAMSEKVPMRPTDTKNKPGRPRRV